MREKWENLINLRWLIISADESSQSKILCRLASLGHLFLNYYYQTINISPTYPGTYCKTVVSPHKGAKIKKKKN